MASSLGCWGSPSRKLRRPPSTCLGPRAAQGTKMPTTQLPHKPLSPPVPKISQQHRKPECRGTHSLLSSEGLAQGDCPSHRAETHREGSILVPAIGPGQTLDTTTSSQHTQEVGAVTPQHRTRNPGPGGKIMSLGSHSGGTTLGCMVDRSPTP